MNIRSKELRKAVQEAKAKEEEQAREHRIIELEDAVAPYMIGEFSYKLRIKIDLNAVDLLFEFPFTDIEPRFSDYHEYDCPNTSTTDVWVVFEEKLDEERTNKLMNEIKKHVLTKLQSMYISEDKINVYILDQQEDFTISNECPAQILRDYNNRHEIKETKDKPKKHKQVVKIR